MPAGTFVPLLPRDTLQSTPDGEGGFLSDVFCWSEEAFRLSNCSQYLGFF